MADAVRWWDMRPAQSRQAKTYECPVCHGLLWAVNPNTLLFPEGDRPDHQHPARRSWWRRLFASLPLEQRDTR